MSDFDMFCPRPGTVVGSGPVDGADIAGVAVVARVAGVVGATGRTLAVQT